MNHLGTDGLAQLKRLASAVSKQDMSEEDNDIPELIETFENAMTSAEDNREVVD